MWLQLMWLQFEVVRGPVGVVCDRFEVGGPQAGPKSTLNDFDRTSGHLKLLPHKLQPHHEIAEFLQAPALR